MNNAFTLIKEWQALRRYRGLDPKWKKIVFYAEDAASYVYFQPIIDVLIGRFKQNITYIASAWDDPILHKDNQRIKTFCVGTGAVRTYFFISLTADQLVMTMPDLETFHIKRSKVHPVHYTYLFHSMVSTHLIYRKKAFYHYDSILCVGPHHSQEIRQTEKSYHLKPKTLYDHGYGRLDAIMQESKKTAQILDENTMHVLVAPSWGENGLLEKKAEELIEALLKTNYHITIRPHPFTLKKHPKLLKSLKQSYASYPNIVFETDIRSTESYFKAHCVITDWSGAALEYAFGLERPVVFIDMPKKINNPDYKDIDSVPVEIALRSEIGAIVSPDHLEELGSVLQRTVQNRKIYQGNIKRLRSQTVFNIGKSGEAGAQIIKDIAEEKAGQYSSVST